MRAVNLIPAEQRGGAAVGAGRSEGGAYAVLALCGGLALMALLYGMARHQVSSRRSQAASITAQATQAQSAVERLAPYTSFIALREQRTQAVNELVNSRFDWAHVFHEFGRVLPVEISISSLSGTIAGTTAAAAPQAAAAPSAAASSASAASASAASTSVTSATPPGSVPTFTLTGCATSQPAVAVMLERLRLMDGVNAVTLQSSTRASSGASSGGSSGGCPSRDPAFTAEVTFDALPTAAATVAATKTVAASSGVAASAARSSSSGATAR